jgi:hypothetical protein
MSAPDLRSVLLEIHRQHGYLTPALVVDLARDNDHPLHAVVFDRSPEDAAEAWYLARAHELIRRVRVTHLPAGDGEPLSVRAFQAVRGATTNAYVYEPSEEVAANPLLAQMVLRDMERDWRTLRARWGHFAEFVRMVRDDLGEPPPSEEAAA